MNSEEKEPGLGKAQLSFLSKAAARQGGIIELLPEERIQSGRARVNVSDSLSDYGSSMCTPSAARRPVTISLARLISNALDWPGITRKHLGRKSTQIDWS